MTIEDRLAPAGVAVDALHIRLWSGPHNIAAALLRAWENRGDCSVASHAGGRPIWFELQQTLSLPWIGWDWVQPQQNILLIRDPSEILARWQDPQANLSAEDLGLPQLNRLFERLVDRAGHVPTVIDATSFLQSPQAHLRSVCAVLGVEFSPRMLEWPSLADDPAVANWEQCAAAFASDLDSRALSEQLSAISAECMPMYRRLYEYRLVPETVGA